MQTARHPVLGLLCHYDLRVGSVHQECPRSLRTHAGVQHHRLAARPNDHIGGVCCRLYGLSTLPGKNIPPQLD